MRENEGEREKKKELYKKYEIPYRFVSVILTI